jgi:16S rRNA (cytosine1402-N4)-methyltransferase
MRAKTPIHQTVLLEETMAYLEPRSGGIYLDATFGGGGHSRAMLERSGPAGQVVGVDRDPNVRPWANELKKEFGTRFSFYPVAYDQMGELGRKFDGILFDLGLSSDQLEHSGRGFTFQKDEPLDMRFDSTQGQRASDLLMQSSRAELEHIFRDFAEDRHWRRVAEKIATSRRERPLRTTFDLIKAIGNENPAVLAPLFQGIRIAANRELTMLEQGLENALGCLKIGGTLVVISFHSLEDRVVKHFFKQQPFRILTKKPLVPSLDEQQQNRRSRSAKLRAGRLFEHVSTEN